MPAERTPKKSGDASSPSKIKNTFNPSDEDWTPDDGEEYRNPDEADPYNKYRIKKGQFRGKTMAEVDALGNPNSLYRMCGRMNSNVSWHNFALTRALREWIQVGKKEKAPPKQSKKQRIVTDEFKDKNGELLWINGKDIQRLYGLERKHIVAARLKMQNDFTDRVFPDLAAQVTSFEERTYFLHEVHGLAKRKGLTAEKLDAALARYRKKVDKYGKGDISKLDTSCHCRDCTIIGATSKKEEAKLLQEEQSRQRWEKIEQEAFEAEMEYEREQEEVERRILSNMTPPWMGDD